MQSRLEFMEGGEPMVTHFGYDAASGANTGYPDAQQEQDLMELGERVVLEQEAERDNYAWPA
jgi:hypothetical protein